MTFLRRWNRLTLCAWLAAPFAVLLILLTAFGGMRIHGGGHNPSPELRNGLLALALCGLAGLAAACGVGCARGARPRGRVLGALLVPAGVWAAWGLVGDVHTYGWEGWLGVD